MYVKDIEKTPAQNLKGTSLGAVRSVIHRWDTGAIMAFGVKSGFFAPTKYVHGDELVDVSKQQILCKNRLYDDAGKHEGGSVLNMHVYTNDWTTRIGKVTDAAFDTDTMALYHLEMIGSSGAIQGKKMLVPRNHILEITKKGVHVDHVDQLEPVEEEQTENVVAGEPTAAMHMRDSN